MILTVGERRKIGRRAAYDKIFYDQLHTSPYDAIEQEVGRDVVRDRAVEVIDEGDDWMIVLVDREGIEAVLPQADDVRSALENRAYMMLRDQPALYDEAMRDPRGFIEQVLGQQLDNEHIVIHRDDAKTIKLVVYSGGDREELSDDMLDMAGGAGGPTCNPPPGGGQRNIK